MSCLCPGADDQVVQSEAVLTAFWFYLSASPYNLYSIRGQIILRTMSWMELQSFRISLTVRTQEYKKDGDEVATNEEMDSCWRLDTERSRCVRYYVSTCRQPFPDVCECFTKLWVITATNHIPIKA